MAVAAAALEDGELVARVDEEGVVEAWVAVVVHGGGEDHREDVDRREVRLDARLVLDNCEHVAPAVTSAVTALLLSCPNVTVLATSRQPLHIVHEQPRR